MPYIITTYPQDQEPAVALEYGTGRRHAVATLDEARERASDVIKGALRVGGEPRHNRLREIQALPETGGTIGPLPDGTVIEVEPISWDEIFRIGHPRDQDLPRSRYGDFELIDAFNAAQGS